MSPLQQSAIVDRSRQDRRSELAALYLRIAEECQRHREQRRLLTQLRREERQHVAVADQTAVGGFRVLGG
jgi:hypothetical protein